MSSQAIPQAASAILLFSLACGPGASKAPPAGPQQPSAQESAASDVAGAEKGSSAEAPQRPMSFDEAKRQSDGLWTAAEKQNTSAAWEAAAAALAHTAKTAQGNAEAAKPLLRGALAAWQRSESLEPQPAITQRQKRPLSVREAQRVEVFSQLGAMVDEQDPEQAMIHYQHGRALWNFGHYVAAAGHFLAVVDGFPAKPEAKFAAGLLLDSLVSSNDLRGLEKHAAMMLKNKALTSAHPGLVADLELIRHQAGSNDAKRLVDQEQYQACGDAYLALFRRDKDLPNVRGDELLYNASVCFERAKKNKSAIKSLRQLMRLYPQSQFAANAKERAKSLASQR